MRGDDPFFPDGLPSPGPDHPGPASSDRKALPPPGRRRATPGGAPDAWALLRCARGRWLLALTLGTAAGAAAGLAAWKVVPEPKYAASTLIEVKAEKPNLLPGAELNRVDMKIFQSTQLSLVRSRLVLNAALGRPGVKALPTVAAQADPVEWLSDELLAEFPAGSELMRLSLSGDRPADLAAVVNAVTEAYIDEVVSKDHNELSAASGQLKDLLDVHNERLKAERARLQEMAETVGSDDKQTLALKQQMALQLLGDEKRELGQIQSDLKKAKAELSVLNDLVGPAALAGPDPAKVAEALDREPLIEQYKERASALASTLDRVRRLTRNETDPSVREVKRKLDKLRRDESAARASLRPRVVAELSSRDDAAGPKQVADLVRRVRVLEAHEAILREEIDAAEGDSQVFNRQTLDLQWIKDRITSGEEIAKQLSKKVETINVELKAPQRGRVIEFAEKPRIESPRKRLTAVALAVAGAFGAGVLGVAWREYRLRRVGSPDDVSEGLGLRLVGTLPALPAPAERGKGGPPARDPGRWEDLLVESIDAARTVILRDCHAGDLRTLLITSAVKGEGKSSLSGHLAVSVARTGRRTLLIDLDLRRPSVHQLFDVDGGPGASEILRGEATIDEAVQTVAADLDVVHAGRTDPRAVRALGQPALPELIAGLASRYDLVVIDSAPILPVADSLLISQHVDAVLLSVFREVSRMPAVHAGYDRLASLGVRVLGAVVTGMPAGHYGAEYRYTEARAT